MEVEVRVLIAPDSFTGTLTSSQAAETIAQGWAQAAPWDELDIAAISDGGPGFLDAIAMDAGIELLPIFVKSLTQQLIPTAIGLTKVDQRTAYIESATIIGSALVAIFPKTPEKYSSFGIGEAILAAKEQGAKKVIVGLGGTGLVDGGAGMLAALGARPAELLTQGGLALSDLTFVDLEPVISAVAGMEFQIATDVLVPLLGERGAAIGFGAQKGADRETQIQLEKSLQHFSFVLGKRSDGKDPALILGAGAAGGLGFGLLHLNAKVQSGFSFVDAALGLTDRIAASDLVITGEGAFDWQSMHGKAIAQVAKTALQLGKPVVVLAGRVEVGRREWSAQGIVGAYAAAHDGEIPEDPQMSLSSLATRVARTYSPNPWQT
ncbi:MAG: hypothetical protein RL587_877 [Actinomycetota bacterium]|jgi:glycerate kinase